MCRPLVQLIYCHFTAKWAPGRPGPNACAYSKFTDLSGIGCELKANSPPPPKKSHILVQRPTQRQMCFFSIEKMGLWENDFSLSLSTLCLYAQQRFLSPELAINRISHLRYCDRYGKRRSSATTMLTIKCPFKVIQGQTENKECEI